ncbi:MAG: hypothetical protein BroJett040_21220 [Oligoflexia bacterium]|nr:MAG: hypothetical protein BroJett040_21220 [Oligoflexia bacterium]
MFKFLLAFLFASSAFAVEYLEVDTVYRLNEKGEKSFRMDFDSEGQKMVATLGLEIINPEVLNQSGYDLSRAESYRIAFPSEAMGCELVSAGGQMTADPKSQDNQVILKYVGSECEGMRDGFRVNLMTTVVFYNVPTLNGQGENAEVLRVRVYDYAP